MYDWINEWLMGRRNDVSSTIYIIISFKVSLLGFFVHSDLVWLHILVGQLFSVCVWEIQPVQYWILDSHHLVFHHHWPNSWSLVSFLVNYLWWSVFLMADQNLPGHLESCFLNFYCYSKTMSSADLSVWNTNICSLLFCMLKSLRLWGWTTSGLDSPCLHLMF